ncbi:MAG: ABC transporter substrate-binding protein [Oribacterium sp.]
MKRTVILGGIAVAELLSATAAMTGCGSSAAPQTTQTPQMTQAKESAGGDSAQQPASVLAYKDIVLGSTGTDIEAEISFFNNRTDMDSEDYGGVNWKQYLAAFHKEYPGIKVDITTDTNYAEDALTHLQSGDYETVMMIPHIDKADLPEYFTSYGALADMEQEINYADTWEYENQVYGVPSTITTQGIVYNKRIFEEAGITEIPKTSAEFLDALRKIRENTDAIPLYTNYAAGWTMGAWDAYIVGNATGDETYRNRKLLHTANPFRDYGDDTHAYAVYKILYNAVAGGLTEEDYTTTDWEGSKTMLNEGRIGCMVLGSWAYPQMEAAGEHAEEVGYMPFPITVNGQQYATAAPDYCYGINVNASDEEKNAAMIFVKWMTEKSGFAYNEDGLPVAAWQTETKLAFEGITFVRNAPAAKGEEDLYNTLNADSELNIDNGGNTKIQEIIEHAAKGDKRFDEIMEEWNQKWTDAQKANGVEITEA